MVRTLEYYEGRYQVVSGRHKENGRILAKLRRKINKMRREAGLPLI